MNYHLVKFGGHRHCGSKAIILVSHMTLQDYVIKGSCDLIGKSSSK